MNQGTELEQVITRYVDEYAAKNHAAAIVKQALEEIGIGLFPVLDHITVRTSSIDPRAEEFLLLGYAYAETLEYDDWWAKVYRASNLVIARCIILPCVWRILKPACNG